MKDIVFREDVQPRRWDEDVERPFDPQDRASEIYYVDYEALVASFDVEVLLERSDDGYQGDTFAVLRDGDGRYGYFAYGWGSCSGCDAAQACRTVGDAIDLRDTLWSGIHWEDSARALLTWFVQRDWGLQWEGWGSHSAARPFRAEAVALLWSLVDVREED